MKKAFFISLIASGVLFGASTNVVGMAEIKETLADLAVKQRDIDKKLEAFIEKNEEQLKAFNEVKKEVSKLGDDIKAFRDFKESGDARLKSIEEKLSLMDKVLDKFSARAQRIDNFFGIPSGNGSEKIETNFLGIQENSASNAPVADKYEQYVKENAKEEYITDDGSTKETGSSNNDTSKTGDKQKIERNGEGGQNQSNSQGDNGAKDAGSSKEAGKNKDKLLNKTRDQEIAKAQNDRLTRISLYELEKKLREVERKLDRIINSECFACSVNKNDK